MKKITLDDIDFDVDYEDLGLLESALMHEIKTFGKMEFISKYTEEVKMGGFSTNTYAENLVVAMINDMCQKDKIEPPNLTIPKLKKFVLGYRDFYILNYTSKKKKLIRKAYKSSQLCFKERGFLFEKAGGI